MTSRRALSELEQAYLAARRWFRAHGEAIALFGCLAVAFSLRLLYLASDAMEYGDSWTYKDIALRFRALGFVDGFDPTVQNFYSLLMAIASPSRSELLATGRAISFIAGVSLVLPVWSLARGAGGLPAAAAAGLFIATQPSLIRYSGLVTTESLYILAFTLALTMSWRAATTGGPAAWTSSGLLWGLAFLVRTEAVFYPLIAIPLIWNRRGRRPALLAALGFLACLGPFLVLQHHHLGRWTLRGGIELGLIEHIRPLTELDADGASLLQDRWTREGAPMRPDELLHGLAFRCTAALRAFYEMYRYHLDWHLGLVPLALAGIGLLAMLRGPHPARLLLLWLGLLVAATILGYAFYLYRPRYLTFLDPLWAVFVGAGWSALLLGWPDRKAGLPERAGLATAAALIALAPILKDATYASYRDRTEQPLEFREAGRWIAEQAPTVVPAKKHALYSQVIVSRERWTSLYADAAWAMWPEAELPPVIAYAKANGARWLVQCDGKHWSPPHPATADTAGVRLAKEIRGPELTVQVWEVLPE